MVNATNGWNTFPLTAPLEVTAGDYYWLVIWSDTVGALVQADTFGTSYFGDYSYTNLSGEWPDTVVLPNSSQLFFLDAPARTYCIYGEGTALGPQPGLEFDLRGNGKLIVAGDTTPSTLDGTDFGSAAMNGSGVQQTFTITNSGSAPLQLTGNPIVTIAGQHARDFTVTSQPASPIAPGAGATFTVQFNPLNQGLRAATISIANNDTLENPYQFAVQGAGFIAGLESIWPATLAGKDINFDGTVYDLGTIFQASVPGTIVKLRVYSVVGDTGDHTASIWNNAADTVIAGPYTWNYGGVNGWITMDIPPVDINADTLYTRFHFHGHRSEARLSQPRGRRGDCRQQRATPLLPCRRGRLYDRHRAPGSPPDRVVQRRQLPPRHRVCGRWNGGQLPLDERHGQWGINYQRERFRQQRQRNRLWPGRGRQRDQRHVHDYQQQHRNAPPYGDSGSGDRRTSLPSSP